MPRRLLPDGRLPFSSRLRAGSSSSVPAHEPEPEQAEPEPVPIVVQQPDQYPGGPTDTSLLYLYPSHVGRFLWYGEKKCLKVASHGKKHRKMVLTQLPRQIEDLVRDSGLAALQHTSLLAIDPNLVSVFVERWHSETSSFHMLLGEMTITLDDVSCLLHLPVGGSFWIPHHVTDCDVVELVVDYLGVRRGDAASHVHDCRGAYYGIWIGIIGFHILY
ncbi:protein MAIN-LIKE 2-like [Vicia villosa]|uniref:protein MAIN-LIKE 2-like n=1 Tax=Vicia villosa TaxID=3911 RepID=UPI00273AB465|nr:protein MAIN-LIKE 2-like [Vicia villosa]